MKSMAKAVLFGGVILAAQAATADGLAFPSASDDAGNTLAARVTYVDTLRNDGLVSVAPGFRSSWIRPFDPIVTAPQKKSVAPVPNKPPVGMA